MGDISVLRKQVKQFVEKAGDKELRIIYNLFEMEKKEDWWDEISEQKKSAIKQAIYEANKGETIPHTEMVKKYRKWLKK